MKIHLILFLLAASMASAQERNGVPSVADLIGERDRNEDGKLSREEAAGSARTKRQFPRWDTDGDGFATREEIIAMRKKFGIDAEGKRISNGRPREQTGKPAATLVIPAVDEITRTGGGLRPTREEMQWSLTIVGTEPHAVSDDTYFILTDHTEEAYLKPLSNLAAHRKATILRSKDLATLHANEEEWKILHATLVRAKPRYVAIVPRPESYREKMLIGMWKLLSTLDDDPQLDVLPGLLLAPDAASFEQLIARSIAHKPQAADEFRPFLQCHFTDTTAGGIKSLQKVGILREHFNELGHKTAALVVAARQVRNGQPIHGDDITYTVPERRLLQSFPEPAREHLAKSSLLVMFGHGSPGMSCGISVDAFHDLDLDNKVVMAGSCWSAAPGTLDFPMPRRDAAGTELEDTKERFLMRAVQNGAVVSFGHMRLNQGFSTLYPVLEAWTDGKTVGEAYQELMNALIRAEKPGTLDHVLTLEPGSLKSDADRRSPAIPGNRLLYVIIGDPALQPYEMLASKK